MACYRAKNLLLIGSRLILVDEEFESELVPGRNWEPLDDAAKAAVEARGALPEMPPLPGAHKKPLVEIPQNWRDLKPELIINLARQLGAPVKGTKHADAIAHIEREVANRDLVPA